MPWLLKRLRRTNTLASSALLLLILLATGCANLANQHLIEVAPNTFLSLPSPAQFGGNANISQLITAKWQDETASLPVHLEITAQRMVLVGSSLWGTRILTVEYANNTITQDTLLGLNTILPDARQVLFSIMLTLWPQPAWQPHLAKIGWTLIDKERSRILVDTDGIPVIKINYDERPATGEVPSQVQFQHLRQDYQITISTQK